MFYEINRVLETAFESDYNMIVEEYNFYRILRPRD